MLKYFEPILQGWRRLYSASLKLRPYGAIEIRLLLFFKPSVGIFPRGLRKKIEGAYYYFCFFWA